MTAYIHTLSTPALLPLIAVAMYVVIKGADYFVDGASSVARTFGISTFVIGLTVVAIGTSAPELFVNIIAARSGATELSIGNILGSNIANILLALGVSAVFAPLAIHSRTVWKELPYSLLAGVMVFVLGADMLFGGAGSIIARNDGLVLLAFFVIFMVYTFGLAKVKGGDTDDVSDMGTMRASLYIIGGLLALMLGGRAVVELATALATHMGMSQNLIGLTVVAIGTSLPEIVTSVSAVRKGLTDMVVGGIIGSNIFNIFLVLGTTASIAPLPFSVANVVDALVLMVVSAVLFVVMFIGKRHTLERWQGGVFIALYITYIIFAIIRG